MTENSASMAPREDIEEQIFERIRSSLTASSLSGLAKDGYVVIDNCCGALADAWLQV